MRTLLLAVALAAGCLPTLPSYTLTEGLDVHPASRPLQGQYSPHILVAAEGCEPGADVASLIQEATGNYDLLVQVTVAKRVTYVESIPQRVCWEVKGVGAYLGDVDPVAEAGRRAAEAARQ